MKKPNIFICGPSGSGKSSSLRNLNPEKTIILNIEQKQLPFKSAAKFTRQAMIPTLERFEGYFTEAIKKSDADVVVIESFTTLCEMIMAKAKKLYTGWDIRNYYNDTVYKILQQSKQADNYVIFLGINQMDQTEGGETWHSIKIDGQLLKGTIEKEFVLVLFTSMRYDAQGKVIYEFITKEDPTRSAKSPMEMLQARMPNDLVEVIKQSEEYYKGE